MAFLCGPSGKEPACQCGRHKRQGFDPWVGTIPQRRVWQANPVFLPGESHGQRNLMSYGLQGGKELDMTEATQHACMLVLSLYLKLVTGMIFFFLQHLKEIVIFLTTDLTSSLANLNESARSHMVPFPPSLPHHKRGLVASLSYSCYHHHHFSPEPLFSSSSLQV